MANDKKSGFRKSFGRRFSKAEHAELRRILEEERRKLLRRPMYVTGNILMLGLTLYFLVRASGPERFAWPAAADVIQVLVSVGIGMAAIWLLLKIPKLKAKLGGLWVILWGVWMTCFGILMKSRKETSGMKWDYLLYALVVLFGWLCIDGAIKEHLCESILKMRKNEDECRTEAGTNKCGRRLLCAVGIIQIYGAFAFAVLTIGTAIFGFMLRYHMGEGKSEEVIFVIGAILLTLYSYAILSRKKGFAFAILLGFAICTFAFLYEGVHEGIWNRGAFMWWGLWVILLGQGVLGIDLLESAAKMKKEALLEESETECLRREGDLL